MRHRVNSTGDVACATTARHKLRGIEAHGLVDTASVSCADVLVHHERLTQLERSEDNLMDGVEEGVTGPVIRDICRPQKDSASANEVTCLTDANADGLQRGCCARCNELRLLSGLTLDRTHVLVVCRDEVLSGL